MIYCIAQENREALNRLEQICTSEVLNRIRANALYYYVEDKENIMLPIAKNASKNVFANVLKMYGEQKTKRG